jgi:hypothetical protein
MDTSPDDILHDIATRLASAFGADRYRISHDPQSEAIFIAIPGLDRFTEEEIEAAAGPLLDDIDLEYEEIVLIPD